MRSFGACSALIVACLWMGIRESGGQAPQRPVGDPAVSQQGTTGSSTLSDSDWSEIRAAHESWNYSFHPSAEGQIAFNAQQNWTICVNDSGFLVQPKEGDWKWGLELLGYGFPGATRWVEDPESIVANGQQLTRTWDEQVDEWYINDARGLEHGFTVTSRPKGPLAEHAVPLVFEIAVCGGLIARVNADSTSVAFIGEDGQVVLSYSGLKVWDADDRVLPAHFSGGGDTLRLEVSEHGAQYPLTIDPIAHQAYLKAGNNAGLPNEEFGAAVAISGDTMVIGAPYEDGSGTGSNPPSDEDAADAGAAYVFVKDAGIWKQQAYLKASNTGPGDNFGASVAISGNTIIVGAPGEDGNGGSVNPASNNFSSNSGAAYVFGRNGDTWSQEAYIKASNTGSGDQFGKAVTVDGDIIVVGAPEEDGSGTGINPANNNSAAAAGSVYVYVRYGASWAYEAQIKASNNGFGDKFGFAVAMSGAHLVVGAPVERGSGKGINPPTDEAAYSAGAAYVFARSGSTWTEEAYLKASNAESGDYFGHAVSISGTTIAVGADWEDSSGIGIDPPDDNNTRSAGAVYVFVRDSSTWSQQALIKASDPAVDSYFGTSVSIDQDTLVVGARGASRPVYLGYDYGACYTCVRTGGVWSVPALVNPTFIRMGAGDECGTSVAVSGDTLVVGAPREDGGGRGVNPSQNDFAFAAGASHVHTRSGSSWNYTAYLKPHNTNDSFGTYDAFGTAVAVSEDTLVIGAPMEDGSGTGVNPPSDEFALDSGAAYVFVRTSGVWQQQAYLKADNTGAGDKFGSAVAIDGDVIVIGAPFEASSGYGTDPEDDDDLSASGAVYVFGRSNGVWSFDARIKAHNPDSGDLFGADVAVSGGTFVVGARQEDGGGTVVDAPEDNSAANAGAAYVFGKTDGVWSQRAYLKALNGQAGDSLGGSVGISGDLIILGATGEDGNGNGVNPESNNSANGSGAAYIFARNEGVWAQEAYLKASNTGSGDAFGLSVAVSMGLAVVGAPFEDGSGIGVNPAENNSTMNAGAAYAFAKIEGNWTLQAYLKASNTGTGSFQDDQFGTSVAASGTTALIGAPGEDGSGGGVNPPSNENSSGSGAAYLFGRDGDVWLHKAYIKGSNNGVSSFSGDGTGSSVALDKGTIVLGAPGEDGAGIGVNPSSNEDGIDSGATYVFYLSEPDIAVEHPVGLELTDGQSVIDWGDLDAGIVSEKVFLVRNTGTLDLTGISVTKVGTAQAEFLLNTTNLPATLPPGQSASFTLSFAPLSSGAKTATLRIASNDPNEGLFDFLLTGNGLAPEITVSGNGVNIVDGDTSPSTTDHTDFGGIAAAEGTQSRIFTIFNTGTGTLMLGAVSLTTAQADDFEVTGQPSDSVAPGASTQFEIRFDPSAKGIRSTTLTFDNNDMNENPFNFTIRGTGLNTPPTDVLLSSESVPENTAAFTTVAALTASDPDPTDTHTFSLVSGTGSTDNGSFSISANALHMRIVPNFEVKSSYSIRLRASDGTNSVEKPFVIQVTDVNEAPNDITLAPSIIEENNLPESLIGTLGAQDPDQDNTHTFELVDGAGATDNTVFVIVGKGLVINESANFEAKASYNIRVRVTDQGSLSFEKALLVTVANVNEPPISISLNGTSIGEKNALNAHVGTLSATDTDAVDTHTFTLTFGPEGSDNADFYISGTSLRLRVSADFETKSSYAILVRATDAGGLSHTQPFTVTILNKNEIPSFTKGADQTHPIGTTGIQTIPSWATAIDDGDSTVEQFVTFNAAVLSGASIFATTPSVSSGGILQYTPNGTPGSALVSVTITDDPSINGNAALTSAAQTFRIRVEGPGSVDELDAEIEGDYVLAVATQRDGKILLAGSFSSVQGTPRKNIARLNSEGTLDADFDPQTNGGINAVAIDGGGRILLGGSFSTVQGHGETSATVRNFIARLNEDGTLDRTFDPNANNHVRCLSVQPNGQIMVGGDFNGFQPNGAPSPTPRNYLALLHADGSLDESFAAGANGVVYTTLTQQNGKILVGGDFTTLQPIGASLPVTRRFIARLNPDGTVDTGFDPKANGTVFAILEQPDGKLLLGGSFSSLQPNGAPVPTSRPFVARVQANGSVDVGFSPSSNGPVFGMSIQSDGKLLLCGGFTTFQPNGAGIPVTREYLARLNSDGTVDSGFDSHPDGVVYGLALQEDGRTLVAGAFSQLFPSNSPAASLRNLFARLANDPALATVSAPDFKNVQWTRRGSAPQLRVVHFDVSTDDGQTWSPLGVAQRAIVESDWMLPGLVLPEGGLLRANGTGSGGIYCGSQGMVEQVVPYTVPRPEIAVESPTGSPIPNPTGVINVGVSIPNGASTSQEFTIRNTGEAALTVNEVTLSGADAADFWLIKDPFPLALDPSATSNFTVSFVPHLPGPRSVGIEIQSDSPDQELFQIDLVAEGVGVREYWRHQHFGVTANEGVAADTWDFDRDGIPNLLEWAVGLNPTVAEALPVTANIQNGNFVFRYSRNNEAMAAGAVYEVEWSRSLTTGSWSSDGVTEQIESDDGVTQVVVASLPSSIGDRCFVHLKVTSN